MKVGTLYGSKTRTETDSTLLARSNHHHPYYVRMVVSEHDGGDPLLDALEKAKPKDGETVLNTVEL